MLQMLRARTSVGAPRVSWSQLAYRWQIWFLRLRHRKSYSEFYRHWMNLRAQRDPRLAVGGLWEEIGSLQFETLFQEGLERRHRLLDIGCGALRGGVHFIEYLDRAHYSGIDISEGILDAGKRLLPENLYAEKSPLLIQNKDLELREFEDGVFDFLLAQSLFTHLPEDDIYVCLKSASRVMTPTGRFYFTIFECDQDRYDRDMENFHYTRATIERLCAAAGLDIERVQNFLHPREQVMYKAFRPADEQ